MGKRASLIKTCIPTRNRQYELQQLHENWLKTEILLVHQGLILQRI